MTNRPKLYTLKAMAARLRVPASWLQQQAELGNVPAVRAGIDGPYVFSHVATIKAVARMAETPIGSDQQSGGEHE